MKKIYVIKYLRILLFIFSLIIIVKISGIIIDFINDDSLKGILAKYINADEIFNKDMKKAIGGMFLALSIYGLRELTINKIDDIVEYLLVRDLRKIESQSTGEIIRISSHFDLPTLFSFFFLVLSIPLGVLAYTELIPDEKSNAVYAFNLNNLNQNQLGARDSELFKFYLTFKNDSYELNATSDIGQKDMLKKVILSTQSCIQDPNDTVKYRLKGFASDPGKPLDNILLANKRAKYIDSLIKEILDKDLRDKADRYDIHVHEWKNLGIESMKNERLIFEHPYLNPDSLLKSMGLSSEIELGDSSSAEFLNRRVELTLIKAGKCQ